MPLTPVGASVDADGCAASQRDSDNDGVADDVDLCPASRQDSVDATGCLDETACEDDLDGDGVSGCPEWEEGSDGLRTDKLGTPSPWMPRSGTTPTVTATATTSAETKAMPVRRRRGPPCGLWPTTSTTSDARMTATDSWTNPSPRIRRNGWMKIRTDTATTPQGQTRICALTLPPVTETVWTPTAARPSSVTRTAMA